MLKSSIDNFYKAKKEKETQAAARIQSQGSDDAEDPVNISQLFGQPLTIYMDYNEILLQYKKTKFMQDLYNDIKGHVQKVKVILNAELEALKASPVQFTCDNKLCPKPASKLRQILQFQIVIAVTQNQTVGLTSQKHMEAVELQAVRNQMILNFLQVYHSIKLRELAALVSLSLQTEVPNENKEQVNTSKHLGQMDIGKLLKLSPPQIDADCPLKVIRVLEVSVLQEFVEGLIQEYISLFADKCIPPKMDLRMIQVAPQVGRATKELEGVFLGFFYTLIAEVNEVVRTVLCSPESRAHGFNQIQAGLHIMLQQFQALNRIGPSFGEVFRQQIFKTVISFHFAEAKAAILADLESFNFDQYISLSSSKQILEDLATSICRNFERVKVELALFKQLQSDVDVLYEKCFLETFEGVLEYFQTRLYSVRTVGVGDLSKPPSKKVTPFTVYLMSRVIREISFTSIFSSLCAALNLNHAVETDFWLQFLNEKVSLVKDKYDLFSLHLRKQFIDAYDFGLNQQVGAYI